MKLTIEIELSEEQKKGYEEMIYDSLLSRDIFSTDCCGIWMCGVLYEEAKKEWLVVIDDEADNSTDTLETARADYLAELKEHRFPKGYKIWNRAKAEKAMKYGISKHGLDDWLDGTASDAYAVDDAIQVALLGEITYC